MRIGRRIYYIISTGNVILDTGEREGFLIPTTVEQDIKNFKQLSELNRESFDFIELEYGQFAQDFSECSDYRVNPNTRELEFNYEENSDGGYTEFHRKPLSEQVKELKIAQAETNTTLLELMETILMGGM